MTDRSILDGMESKTTVHYDPEVDIAAICIEPGRAVATEYPWGLIERDRDSGRVTGFEIWRASTVLPTEMIEAMTTMNSPRGVAA